jgi:transcriptional regulator with XRE-family HTH domain
MTDTGAQFRRRLRERRKAANLSQQELAGKLGVAQSYVSQLESGRSGPPTIDRAYDLARACETSVDYLIGLTDNPGPLGRGEEYPAHLDALLNEVRRLPEDAQRGVAALAAVFVDYEESRAEQNTIGGMALSALEMMLPEGEMNALLAILEELVKTGDIATARLRIAALFAAQDGAESLQE